MNIFFRSSNVLKYKDSQRRYVRFKPLLLGLSNQNNFISTTANDASIDSTLNSICYAYKFSRPNEFIKYFYSKNVEFIYQYSPHLILVPQTYGKLHNIEAYLNDIFNRLDSMQDFNLHFTHYSLITENFPNEELRIFLSFLLKKTYINNTNNIYFDIDEHYLIKTINLYQELAFKIRGVKHDSIKNLLVVV